MMEVILLENVKGTGKKAKFMKCRMVMRVIF